MIVDPMIEHDQCTLNGRAEIIYLSPSHTPPFLLPLKNRSIENINATQSVLPISVDIFNGSKTLLKGEHSSLETQQRKSTLPGVTTAAAAALLAVMPVQDQPGKPLTPYPVSEAQLVNVAVNCFFAPVENVRVQVVPGGPRLVSVRVTSRVKRRAAFTEIRKLGRFTLSCLIETTDEQCTARPGIIWIFRFVYPRPHRRDVIA